MTQVHQDSLWALFDARTMVVTTDHEPCSTGPPFPNHPLAVLTVPILGAFSLHVLATAGAAPRLSPLQEQVGGEAASQRD